jgi:predicted nucleic acid-binding protein
MKIIIDTNIALDVLLNRTEFLQPSNHVLKLSALGKVKGFLTTNTITDMFYVLYRNSKDASKSREAITKLIKLITLEAVLPSDISLALTSDIADLEDAVICFAAKRIKADYIVTRNIADYTNSPIPAIEPVDFISTHFADI